MQVAQQFTCQQLYGGQILCQKTWQHWAYGQQPYAFIMQLMNVITNYYHTLSRYNNMLGKAGISKEINAQSLFELSSVASAPAFLAQALLKVDETIIAGNSQLLRTFWFLHILPDERVRKPGALALATLKQWFWGCTQLCGRTFVQISWGLPSSFIGPSLASGENVRNWRSGQIRGVLFFVEKDEFNYRKPPAGGLSKS